MKLLISSILLWGHCLAIQQWTEQPRYQEVNPHGSLVMKCLVQNKKGECRWEKDGDPVGMYPTKYEWAGRPEDGDCSLRILDASLEFDDGVWQCQVTPTSFLFKDSLISEGAELVVRGKNFNLYISLKAWDLGQSLDSSTQIESYCLGDNVLKVPTKTVSLADKRHFNY